MPLAAADCRLMAPELVEKYNRLEAQFDEARQLLPELVNDAAVKAAWQRLREVAALMLLDRYRVGFMGRSQIGKSTSINTVLDAPKGKEPCVSGAGAATTSAVTRIAASRDGGYHCRLSFMTSEEFQARRRDLTGLLDLTGFPVNPGSDHATVEAENAKILAQMDEQKAARGRGGKPAPPDPARDADLAFLRRLLVSFQQHGRRVVRAGSPVERDEDYDRRKDYTSHAAGEEASEYLLLREVSLELPLSMLGDKVEVIDLPGLGSRLVADDTLTKSYLPKLDGALVFQSSEQVAAKEAYDLLAGLWGRFEGMGGRVWMVITRMDGLTRPQLHGDANDRTLMDNLARTLEENSVPHDQVLMISNRFHDRWKEAGGKPKADAYGDVLGVEVAGEVPTIPEAFDRHGKLREAFSHVLDDGGVARVRGVIGRQLGDRVQQQVRLRADDDLGRIRDELRHAVDLARQRAALDPTDFVHAMQWAAQVRVASDRLVTERRAEPHARALGAELQALFVRLFPEAGEPPSHQLPRAHGVHADLLRKKAQSVALEKTLPGIHGEVRGTLERCAREAQLKPIARLEGGDVLGTLERLFREDVARGDWYERDLSFDEVPLFPAAEAGRYLDASQYRRIMRTKIDAVVGRLVLTIEVRVRRHLDALQSDLSRLGERQAVASADGATYQQILNGLGRV